MNLNISTCYSITVTMVAHVLLQLLATSVNAHFHSRVATVKQSLLHQLLDQSVHVSFVHAHHLFSLLLIHVFQIHVKTMVAVLFFIMLLDATVQTHTAVITVNLVCS